MRLSKKIVWKKSANKQQNSANKHAERLPVVVLHLLHPAVVLFVALVGFLAELSPETGHGRFGISLLQIRIVSYHWWQIWFLKKEKSPKFSFLTMNLVLFLLRDIIFHHSTMLSHKKWMVPAFKRFFFRYKDLWLLKMKNHQNFHFWRRIWFFLCWETLFFITLLCSVIKSGWCPQRASFQFLPAFRIIGTLKPSNWFSVTWRTIASPRLQLFRQMAARQLGRRWRRFGLIVTSACAGSTPRKTANVNWVSFHNVSLLLHFY